MLTAIDFDGNQSLKAGEIQNEVAEWMLAPEFAILHLSTPELLP